MPEADLPDGWERVDEDAVPYYKLVKRDAVQVPKRYAGDEPMDRDCVVLVTDTSATICQGPGVRHSFEGVSDPDSAALAIAETVEAWLQDGHGPYGDDELTERLEDAVGTEAVVP